MNSLTKGQQMNKHHLLRKDLGTVGHYFPVDPFQCNLYESFQSKSKKHIQEDISLLQSKPKQVKKKKISFEDLKQLPEDPETKIIVTKNPGKNTENPKEDKDIVNDPSVKMIHVTNLTIEKDKVMFET